MFIGIRVQEQASSGDSVISHSWSATLHGSISPAILQLSQTGSKLWHAGTQPNEENIRRRTENGLRTRDLSESSNIFNKTMYYFRWTSVL